MPAAPLASPPSTAKRVPGRRPALLAGSSPPCTRELRRLYIRNPASSLVALPGVRAGPRPCLCYCEDRRDCLSNRKVFRRGRPVFADRNGVVSRITVRKPAHGQFNAIARLASATGIIGPKPSEKGLDLLSKE